MNPLKSDYENDGLNNKRVLYFNAFTEDLFTWENDLNNDKDRYLTYKKNTAFGKYIEEQSVDQHIEEKFKSLVGSDISVRFEHIEDTDNMSVKFLRGGKTVKISRGEERLFTWCVFLVIVENDVKSIF